MSVVKDSAKRAPNQALDELQSILRKPYQDVCNVCNGAGKITQTSVCPKCKGSGQRLLRLL
jgi:DnaJ-class molecular chaperone